MKRLAFIMCLLISFSLCGGCSSPLKGASVSTPAQEEEIDNSFDDKNSDYNAILSRAKVSTALSSMSPEARIESLKDLEDKSSLIVIAKVLDKKQVMYDDPTYEELGYQSGITVATLQVENVFAGDSVSKNDKLDIAEYCFITYDAEGTPTINTQLYYYPSKIGERYLFFLRPDTSDWYENPAKYTPTVLVWGKYVINKTTIDAKTENPLTSDVLEIAAKTPADGSIYWKVYEEIRAKYFPMDSIRDSSQN